MDEVHTYTRWSRELKNIYDRYLDLRVIFSASSALDIYHGESDLSRRVISYYLPGLSFREYIILNNTIEFSPITLEEIVQSHRRISLDTTNQFQPLPIFKDYLQYGYLPIILEGKDSYLPKISQIIMIPTYHIFSHITQEQPQKKKSF
ncbi:AAA family ATPase [Membranihabitans maritimus]|uniref:AAA family ATPase n=1 Tax=Membranihabitans maritimus TaxID=2904244 RepID=UPI0034E214F6